MADLETEPLVRSESHVGGQLVLEQRQLHYVTQYQNYEETEFVYDTPREWKSFSFGSFMVAMLFMLVWFKRHQDYY